MRGTGTCTLDQGRPGVQSEGKHGRRVPTERQTGKFRMGKPGRSTDLSGERGKPLYEVLGPGKWRELAGKPPQL